MFSKLKINSKWYIINWDNVLYVTVEDGKCHVFFNKPVDGISDAILDDIEPWQLDIILLGKKVE